MNNFVAFYYKIDTKLKLTVAAIECRKKTNEDERSFFEIEGKINMKKNRS